MALDLTEIFTADAAESVARRRDDTQLATARQRDASAFDMRALGAALASEIVTSDDTTRFAGLNAAVRVPTTLNHPNAVVGP